MTDTPKNDPIEIKEPVAPQLPDVAPAEIATPDAAPDVQPETIAK